MFLIGPLNIYFDISTKIALEKNKHHRPEEVVQQVCLPHKPEDLSSIPRSCITQAFLLASRPSHACHLQGGQGLTRDGESSASGFASSTLWSTARRPQRDWGEAMTLRRARVDGRPLVGRKTKSTWWIGEKGQKTQLLNPTTCLLQFLGISHLPHRTTLVALTVAGVVLLK